MEFEVLPRSAGSGYNSFRYVLRAQGMVFKLSGCETGSGADLRAVAAFEIPSLVFMAWGELQAVRMAYACLRALAVVPTDDLVSRVDLCVDLPGESMDEPVRAHFGNQRVCRAKKFSLNGSGNTIETLYYGAKGSPIQLRIYDKLHHPESAPGTFKRSLLEQHRWGGDVEEAVRVEFQLRRDHLREQHGIHTLKDLFESLETLGTYLVDEWFRFADQPVDSHRHYDRLGVSRFWSKVQQAFKAWTRGRLRERRPGRRAVVSAARMKAQSVGCMVRAVAVETFHNGSEEDVLEAMFRHVGAMMADPAAFTRYVGERFLDEIEAYLDTGNRWKRVPESFRQALRDLAIRKPGFLANQ